MKRTNTNKPAIIELLSGNMYVYRWNIKECCKIPPVMSEGVEIFPSQTMWAYDEVEVFSPITANKITEKVIDAEYGGIDIENKLINDYNGFILGILDESYKDKYIQFIDSRKKLKDDIDDVCDTHNIPNN